MDHLQISDRFHFPVEPVFSIYEEVAKNKVCPNTEDLLTHYHNVSAYRASHRLSPAYQINRSTSLEDIIEMKPTLAREELLAVLNTFHCFYEDIELDEKTNLFNVYFYNISMKEVW